MIHTANQDTPGAARLRRSHRRNWFSSKLNPLAILDGLVSVPWRDAFDTASTESHADSAGAWGQRTAGPHGYRPVEFLDLPPMVTSPKGGQE